MKYLYYSLYLLYTKILFVQKDYPPVINIAGVLAMLQTCFLAAIFNTIYFTFSTSKEEPFSAIFLIVVALLLVWVNLKYYRKHEGKIVKQLDALAVWKKILIVILSFFATIFIFWIWMDNRLYKFTTALIS